MFTGYIKMTHKTRNIINRAEGATSIQAADVIEEDSVRCGIGRCKPKSLQKFATIHSFVTFYSLANLFTFAIRMYLVSQLTTIEKRFGFSSAQSGLILSSSQITFVVSILFYSYYSRAAHIPRILSVTSMIAGATSLLFATAHWIPLNSRDTRSSYILGRSTRPENASNDISYPNGDICTPSNGQSPKNKPLCNEVSSTRYSNTAMGIFVIAMLIQGAVTSARSPLGGTYLDDNNPIRTKSGKYVGILMGALTLSTVVSFGFGAISSGIFHTLEETGLSPVDPQWIGAWWLGFLVLGCFSVLFSSLVLFFPKRLTKVALQDTRIKPIDDLTMTEMLLKTSAKEVLKGILGPMKSVFRIVKIPVFTLLVLANTMHTFAILGMVSFFPKYLETQFYIPAYKASIMLGVISFVGGIFGPVVGGLVTSHFNLTTRGNLRLMLTVCIVLTAGCPVGMVLAGKQTNLVKTHFKGQVEQTSRSCISGCVCSSDVMAPVCGADGLTYHSPCHAGCFSGRNGKYSNCGCSDGTAVSGFCASEDSLVYPLLAYAATVSFTSMFATGASFMIIVRSVTEKDKSLALGLSSFLSTLLGHFPAPVVYGMIVDSACLMWQESCTSRGACALYRLSDFRYKMFGTNMGFFSVSVVLMVFAVFGYKSPEVRNDHTVISVPVARDEQIVLISVV